jgi:hypothetical protein
MEALCSSEISEDFYLTPEYIFFIRLHPWNWFLLEKLPVAQLLKNFPIFYGTRRFIILFTRTHHWSLSCKANPVTSRGDQQGYVTSRLPHLLHTRFTDGGEVVGLTHRPHLYPHEDSWYSFLLRGWADPRDILRLEGLGQLKNPVTSSGIESAASILSQINPVRTNPSCLSKVHSYYNPTYT